MEKKIPYEKFFGDKKAIIVSASGNLRITLRGIVRQLGISANNVLMAQTFEEAAKLIDQQMPEIIITEFSIEEKSCIELVDKQRQHKPIRLKSLSCVISSMDLSVHSSKSLDREIDLHLIQPITADLFEKAVAKIILQKLKPNAKLQLLEKVRLLYSGKKYAEALSIIDAVPAEAQDAKLLYYKGSILAEKNDLVAALDCWEHGLDLEPENYWCLKSLFNHFITQKLPLQNYKITLKLLDHHPLNPEWIPHITRIFIANEQYKKVVEYFDVFVNWDNLDEMKQEAEQINDMHATIAACMVISANFIHKMGDKPLAVEALIKSVRLCKDKPKILSQIIISLVKMYEFDQATKFLTMIEEGDYSPELYGAELQILNLDEEADAQEILKQSIGLIEKGIKSEKVYEIAITRSLEVKRSKDRINALVEDACAYFPKREKFFKDLLQQVISAAS